MKPACFDIYIFYKNVIAVLHHGDWISIIRVTSSDMQVQIHELRVQIHKLRVQIHELQIQIQNIKFYKLKRILTSFTLC